MMTNLGQELVDLATASPKRAAVRLDANGLTWLLSATQDEHGGARRRR